MGFYLVGFYGKYHQIVPSRTGDEIRWAWRLRANLVRAVLLYQFKAALHVWHQGAAHAHTVTWWLASANSYAR